MPSWTVYVTTRTETPKATVWTGKFVSKYYTERKGIKLTSLEVKSHRSTNDPANNDEEGRDQEGNLDRRTNRNTHGEIHLITEGDDNSSDVLSSIANNGNQDQTNESSANSGGLDKIINAVNEVIGADSDEDGSDTEDGNSGKGSNSRLLWLNFLAVLVLVLGVEKVTVCSELEDEI